MPGYQNMEIKIALSGSLEEEKFVLPVIQARVDEALPCVADTITASLEVFKASFTF